MSRTTEAAREPEIIFRDLLEFIDACRDVVARGETVELAGFDARIAGFCSEIEALPPEQGRRYADHLALLYRELDHLGKLLRESQAAVGEQMKALDMHRKASIAYRTSEAHGPKKNKSKKKQPGES